MKPQYLLLFLAIVALRVVTAIQFPVGGDEAYYWEWSRRLAFGYVDHPPLVAWTIAIFDLGAHDALRLRAGFLLCGVIASAATWDFVRNATGSTVRAFLATLALNITPFGLLAFNLATPDGPFLAMWIAALACTQRAMRSGDVRWWTLAGLAVGLDALSRVFAVSLVVGILWAVWRNGGIRRYRTGLIAGASVAAALVAPYIAWNALHGWTGIEFAVTSRHHFEAFSPLRAVETIAAALAVGALFLSPFVVRALAVRADAITLSRSLLIGTAAPLGILLIALSFFEPVELYWFAGPMLSLLVLAFTVPMPWNTQRRWLIPGFAPTALIALLAFILACAPSAFVVRAAKLLPRGVSTASLLEIYSDRPLALALRERYPDSIVFTDEYGLSSMLDFYAGIPPYVIGYNSQGREALNWLSAPRSKQTIYLDHIALSQRPDMVRLLQIACSAVEPMPGIAVREEEIVLHAFSLSRCRDFDGRSIAVLNQSL